MIRCSSSAPCSDGVRKVRVVRLVRAILLVVVILAIAIGSGLFGAAVGRHYETNELCCLVPPSRNVRLSLRETLGLVTFASQIGQDKWVSETVFPGVTDGYFIDVGSGDGIDSSNTLILERKGWKGICVDPFPSNMQQRTCQMFKEVVFSEAGRTVTFHKAAGLGGIDETLGRHRALAEQAPAVTFTTVTIGDILDRAKAPSFIQFMSMDIEGAELEALRGVPWDRYRFGAFAIEHNYEGQKRDAIEALLKQHGYRRVHTWRQDDFYVAADAASSSR